MDLIINTNYTWLPPTVLAIILLFAIIIGYITGWKTALYFMCWNILGMIIGLVIIDHIYDNVAKKLKNLTTSLNFEKILLENKSIAEPIAGVIMTLSILLVFNFIAFLIYWIFRKWLKRKMKEAKKMGSSILITRLFGSFAGVITALPIAFFASSLSTTFSKQNSFTNVSSTMTKAISIGKFSNISQNINHIVVLLSAAQQLDDFKDDFSQIFKNETEITSSSLMVLNKPKNIETLKEILNSPIIFNSLNTIMSDMLKIDKSKMNFVDKNTVKIFNTSLVTDPAKQEKLITQVVKYFEDTPAANATANNVKKYFKMIKLFS